MSQKDARLHAESQHLKIRFPCPLADQFHCSQTFVRKGVASAHARWEHEGVGYPCPLAEQFQCSQTFRRETDARNHTDVHQGLSYPCPAAEKYNCSTTFKLEREARRHVHRQHQAIFCCWLPGCMARFETCARLLAHVNEPDSHMGKFLLCPVSTCPLAVSQTPLPKRDYLHHFRRHQNRGEITGDEIFQEIKPEQASRCDLYDVIIQDAYIDMNWTENLNDKVIGARDYSLKETADVSSLQSRHVPEESSFLDHK